MSEYLLDTNVISELRTPRGRPPNPRVAAWVKRVPDDSLFLSVITVMELELGTLKLSKRDPAGAAVLRAWFEGYVLPTFANRILPIDAAVARRCASLHLPTRVSGMDALIAATALAKQMTVVTRNTSHFVGTGVALLNPWEL